MPKGYAQRTINFTKEEVERLEKESARKGMSLSMYIRHALFGRDKSKPLSLRLDYRRFRDGKEVYRGGIESLETLFGFITVSDHREEDANRSMSFYIVYLDGKLTHIIWLVDSSSVTHMEVAAKFITECNRFAFGSFNGECIVDLIPVYNDSGYGLYVAEAKDYKNRISMLE